MDIWKRHSNRQVNRYSHFLGGSTWMAPREQILMATAMVCAIVLVIVFGGSIQVTLKRLNGPGCPPVNPAQVVCEEGATPPSGVDPDKIIWRKF